MQRLAPTEKSENRAAAHSAASPLGVHRATTAVPSPPRNGRGPHLRQNRRNIRGMPRRHAKAKTTPTRAGRTATDKNQRPNNSRLSMGGRDYPSSAACSSEQIVALEPAAKCDFVDTPELRAQSRRDPGRIHRQRQRRLEPPQPVAGAYPIPGIYVLGESSEVQDSRRGGFRHRRGNLRPEDEPLAASRCKGNGRPGRAQGSDRKKNHDRLPPSHNQRSIRSTNIKAPEITFASLLQRTLYVECTRGRPPPRTTKRNWLGAPLKVSSGVHDLGGVEANV